MLMASTDPRDGLQTLTKRAWTAAMSDQSSSVLLEQGHGQKPYKRTWILTRTGGAVCALLVGVLIVAAVIRTRNVTSHGTFRVSVIIGGKDHADRIHASTFKQMKAALEWRPEMCGISAPNFLHYFRFMVLHRPHRELFNPIVTELMDGHHNVTIEEGSAMCKRGSDLLNKTRVSSIRVQYMDGSWVQQSEVFNGTAAICIQHMIDLFNGIWPCPITGSTQELRPVIPVFVGR